MLELVSKTEALNELRRTTPGNRKYSPPVEKAREMDRDEAIVVRDSDYDGKFSVAGLRREVREYGPEGLRVRTSNVNNDAETVAVLHYVGE